MCCQPFTGRLSDGYGRALFVFVGGGLYGIIAFLVPFAPTFGAALSLPTTYGFVGNLSSAFLPLLVLSGLLGVADSLREPASRPYSRMRDLQKGALHRALAFGNSYGGQVV